MMAWPQAAIATMPQKSAKRLQREAVERAGDDGGSAYRGHRYGSLPLVADGVVVGRRMIPAAEAWVAARDSRADEPAVPPRRTRRGQDRTPHPGPAAEPSSVRIRR